MITKLLHILMGFNTPLTPDQIDRIICLCDLFLGLPSYIYDKDEERRKLYGLLGEYRIQPWGIEYRSLGGGMYHYKKVIQAGLNKIEKIIEANRVDEFFDEFYPQVKEIYNHQLSKGQANILLNKINLF